MKKNSTLLANPRYKKFIQERNQGLERINIHTQTDISRILFEALDSVTGFVSHMAITQTMSLNQMSYLSRQLESYIDMKFAPLSALMERRIMRMRKATFVLTYISELEAVARATKRTKSMTSMDFKQKIHKQLHLDTINGQRWNERLWVALNRVKHDIVEAFQRSLVREESPKEVVDRVKKSYPQIISYKKPPRALKPLREAGKKPGDDDEEGDEFDFYAGLTNDEDWDLAVQSYLDTEIPPSRFDSTPVYDEETGTRRYAWEIEQELTDDFVQQVRDGQIEAATDLGVKDFVVVAVIDKKTCDECCLPRNGKTLTEIEHMLSTGELDANECDGISPPYHPWCRCDLAPVASTDEVEGPDWKSFGDWLES